MSSNFFCCLFSLSVAAVRFNKHRNRVGMGILFYLKCPSALMYTCSLPFSCKCFEGVFLLADKIYALSCDYDCAFGSVLWVISAGIPQEARNFLLLHQLFFQWRKRNDCKKEKLADRCLELVSSGRGQTILPFSPARDYRKVGFCVVSNLNGYALCVNSWSSIVEFCIYLWISFCLNYWVGVMRNAKRGTDVKHQRFHL